MIKKKEKGITLVALVITIVILIILSTVTINMAFGENGLIRQAELARDMTANSTVAEVESMNSLMGEYANVMAEDEEIKEPFIDILPSRPKLSDGMIPVKYVEGTGWIKIEESDEEWYDYANKKWANIVLEDATFEIDGENEILNEDEAYSMLVWIPRYAYQITSYYHTTTEGAGNINIVFIDTENKSKDGKTTYSTTYPEATEGVNGKMSDYVVHPAFDFGGTQLSGFWVGKYETSHTGCTTDKSTGENDTDTTDLTVQIKANVTSWRGVLNTNIFTVCTELNSEGNPYGLNVSDSVVDPHMMKNSEWGAVAYLSQSEYGKKSEIWINPNNNFITGQAGDSVNAEGTETTYSYYTTNGQQASTTGNITGIYDMVGGAWEKVAAYVDNGIQNLSLNGSSLVEAADRYKDIYKVTVDGQQQNYENAEPIEGQGIPTKDTGKYGDAVWETSSSFSGQTSWNNNSSNMPYGWSPFFTRGGQSPNNTLAGLYFLGITNGSDTLKISGFRVVIPVLT